MPGVAILDVAIGLVFVYLMLSLAVTAANEMFAAWFKRRAWMLRKGIDNLLRDPEVATKFFNHPLIQSLYEPAGRVSRLPFVRTIFSSGPSYIPSRTFAIALLDVVAHPDSAKQGRASETAATRPLDDALRLLLKEAGGDDERFKKNVEVWFNDSMERVSGWYKRRTQFISIFWAIVITVGTNADTIVIVKALWSDPSLRQAVVERAEQYVRQESAVAKTTAIDDAPPPPALPPDQQADADFDESQAELRAALADLDELQLPIGWDEPLAPAANAPIVGVRLVKDDGTDDWPGPIWPLWDSSDWVRWLVALDQHMLGWLITVMAVSLGAPFWFDILNKVVSIRSAGKAPEESQKSPKKVPKPKEPGPMSVAKSTSQSAT